MDSLGRRSPTSFGKGMAPTPVPPTAPTTAADRAKAFRPNPGFGDRQGTPGRIAPIAPTLPDQASDRAREALAAAPGFGVAPRGQGQGAGNFDSYLRKINRWTDRLEGGDVAGRPQLGFANRTSPDASLDDPLANLLRLLGR